MYDKMFAIQVCHTHCLPYIGKFAIPLPYTLQKVCHTYGKLLCMANCCMANLYGKLVWQKHSHSFVTLTCQADIQRAEEDHT